MQKVKMFLSDWNKTALVFDGKEISYSETIEKCAAFASLYKIKKGSRVSIFSENRPEWIYSFYSVWVNKGIAVPVDFTGTEENTAYILKDSKPDIIFISKQGEAHIKNAVKKAKIKPQIIIFENINLKQSTIPFGINPSNVHDTAVIMYTSGTTGSPKGVMITYDNLIANIESLINMKMLLPIDSILGLLPFHHILPFQGTILAPFYIGSTVVLVKTLSAEEILKTLQSFRVTMFLGVPKLYEMFHKGIMSKINGNLFAKGILFAAKKINNLNFSKIIFSRVHKSFGGNIHTYLTGGAKFDENIAGDMKALGFRFVEGYGLTETTPLVAFNPYTKIKQGSVGIPMNSCEVKIVNGEIAVKGRNVMKGYYRRPADTAKRIRNGWFFTGDTGHFDNEGYLYVTGRTDEMIVLPNGKNISPEEIEKKIMSVSEIIRDAGVFQKNGSLSVLIYPDFSYLEKNKSINILESIKWNIIDKYNSLVPSYQKIFNISIVKNELPRTRLGKLQRYKLIDLINSEKQSAKNEKDPDSKEYRLIKNYLKNFTSENINPGDHFEIDLGLDSLSMVEFSVFIEKTFGTVITDNILSAYPTVKSFAEFIGKKGIKINKETVNWHEILKENIDIKIKPKKSWVKILQIAVRPLIIFYFRMKRTGLENLPDGPFIIAPNHQSFMDAVLLSAALPEKVLNNTFFTAKDSLKKTVLVKFFMDMTNIIYINIEKDLKDAILQSAAVLKSGKNLVIFPEGHRSRDGKVGKFKKAFAILSRELNVPVIPLAISGAFEALSIKQIIPKPVKIELSFLKPLSSDKNDYEKIAEKVRNSIRKIVEKNK